MGVKEIYDYYTNSHTGDDMYNVETEPESIREEVDVIYVISITNIQMHQLANIDYKYNTIYGQKQSFKDVESTSIERTIVIICW